MTGKIHDFFKDSSDANSGHFHKVIALHENKDLDWDPLSKQIPLLQRGWFELSRLSQDDRIELTRDYWFAKLKEPLANEIHDETRLLTFFDKMEDIGIFATQESESSPFEIHMTYILKESSGFFHGYPPASQETIANLTKQFGNFSFPTDYLAFLEIHDGFSKFRDTGVIRTKEMAKTYLRFQNVHARELIMSPDGQMVDPKSLIPFYESFLLHCYQCFFADWYPSHEVGNVYYSDLESFEHDFIDGHYIDENFAFATFASWLLSYLEESDKY